VHPVGGRTPSGLLAVTLLAVTLAIAMLAACGGSDKREKKPAASTAPSGDVQHGMASWYGGKHHGRGTASGERFDKTAMTAAHRWFPFNTRVRVTNQRNGRAVIVRITDRGPFVRGRIIDVSEAAAEQLGMKRAGVAPVKVERLR
jgi:rare lipoprotein A